jgi:hypothetical protein
VSLPAHSKLGASQIHRIAECPASVRRSEGLHSPTSVYAAEGTLTHAIAAQCLTTGASPTEFIGGRHTVEGYEFVVDEAMADAIAVYLQTVRADFAEFPERPMRLVEHRFHLKELHDDLFGTADCVQIYPAQKLVRVYDYKHGAGVAVEVENNVQLKYYALGALLSTKVPTETVELVIVQPRCAHSDGAVRRYRFPAIELLDYSADLIELARLTESPDAPANAGGWCRWCPAAALCPDLKNLAAQAAQEEFMPDQPYDPAVLAASLALVDLVEGWAKSVRQFVYNEASHGRTIPGYKLVEKRAIRKWIDEHTAEIELQKLGLGESDLYEPRSIRSPAQIEKNFKGAKGKQKIAHLIKAESSGLKLVAESEPGEAVSVKTAQDEFGVIQ